MAVPGFTPICYSLSGADLAPTYPGIRSQLISKETPSPQQIVMKRKFHELVNKYNSNEQDLMQIRETVRRMQDREAILTATIKEQRALIALQEMFIVKQSKQIVDLSARLDTEVETNAHLRVLEQARRTHSVGDTLSQQDSSPLPLPS